MWTMDVYLLATRVKRYRVCGLQVHVDPSGDVEVFYNLTRVSVLSLTLSPFWRAARMGKRGLCLTRRWDHKSYISP